MAHQPGRVGDGGDSRTSGPVTAPGPVSWDGDSGDSGDTYPGNPTAVVSPGVARRTSWTATELMSLEFPPPRWAVPGLICEGITLLAGPPKVGKSWLSLGLGVAVASGGLALGSIRVHQGPVLYLALEDTARRLKSRLEKVLGGNPAPAGLTLATACAPLTVGGDAEIAMWLDEHPDARLIVIDVFAKLRGAPPPGMAAYDADYAAIGRIKRVADHYGVAVVLVHHVRKMASEDFLAEVSGTNGLAGAADAVLVLKRGRGQADGVLHVTGRDIDESEHAAAFEPETGLWKLLDGPAITHTLEPTRRAILAYLDANPDAAPKQITEALGLAYATVKQTVRRMLEDGQLISDGHGHYRTPGAVTPAGVTAVTAVSAAGHGANGGDRTGDEGVTAVTEEPTLPGTWPALPYKRQPPEPP
jgi:hypothetical protein